MAYQHRADCGELTHPEWQVPFSDPTFKGFGSCSGQGSLHPNTGLLSFHTPQASEDTVVTMNTPDLPSASAQEDSGEELKTPRMGCTISFPDNRLTVAFTPLGEWSQCLASDFEDAATFETLGKDTCETITQGFKKQTQEGSWARNPDKRRDFLMDTLGVMLHQKVSHKASPTWELSRSADVPISEVDCWVRCLSKTGFTV